MKEIIDQLLADGWKEYPSYHPNKRMWCKSFPGHKECCGNEGKNKQIEVYYRGEETIGSHTLPPSWSVSTTGELPNRESWRCQIEALKSLESILVAANAILASWDAAYDATPSKDSN